MGDAAKMTCDLLAQVDVDQPRGRAYSATQRPVSRDKQAALTTLAEVPTQWLLQGTKKRPAYAGLVA